MQTGERAADGREENAELLIDDGAVESIEDRGEVVDHEAQSAQASDGVLGVQEGKLSDEALAERVRHQARGAFCRGGR